MIEVESERGERMVEIARDLRVLNRTWKPELAVGEFPPMQIKQALTGHGHAQKDEVLEAVMRELNLNTPRCADSSDRSAFELALAA